MPGIRSEDRRYPRAENEFVSIVEIRPVDIKVVQLLTGTTSALRSKRDRSITSISLDMVALLPLLQTVSSS